MTKPQRFLLARIGKLAGLRNRRLDNLQRLFLTAVSEHGLQLERMIEMILYRGLSPAGDEDELLDSGGTGFLDGVLDKRFIDNREHFLRHRLGCRQETRTKPPNRKDRLPNWYWHI